MREKNHQTALTIRTEIARGFRLELCCIKVPTANQKLFLNVNLSRYLTKYFEERLKFDLSIAEIFAIACMVIETQKYAANTYSHTSKAKGFIKENSFVDGVDGT